MRHASCSPDYREQVDGLALVLAGRSASTAGLTEETARQMRVFAEENREKRLQKLALQLALVSEAFADMDDLLLRYTDEAPQPAYAGFSEDAEGFLAWLLRSRELTPEQGDHVACQRARHAVEARARRKRREHLRFQELWSVAGELSASLEENPELVVHLNPCRVWARFRTPALLGEGVPLPADLVFFARSNEISTAVLERTGRVLVEELEQFGPCPLGEWSWRSQHAGREELAPFCRDLAELGVVAFG